MVGAYPIECWASQAQLTFHGDTKRRMKKPTPRLLALLGVATYCTISCLYTNCRSYKVV
jgi:hypothetical protein